MAWKSVSNSSEEPTLVCDLCGKPISSADPGGPVFTTRIVADVMYTIRHGHAGMCHDILQERLAREIGPA